MIQTKGRLRIPVIKGGKLAINLFQLGVYTKQSFWPDHVCVSPNTLQDISHAKIWNNKTHLKPENHNMKHKLKLQRNWNRFIHSRNWLDSSPHLWLNKKYISLLHWEMKINKHRGKHEVIYIFLYRTNR